MIRITNIAPFDGLTFTSHGHSLGRVQCYSASKHQLLPVKAALQRLKAKNCCSGGSMNTIKITQKWAKKIEYLMILHGTLLNGHYCVTPQTLSVKLGLESDRRQL